MTGLTQTLAEFVSGLSFTDIPSDVHPIVGRGFADCIAVMFLGRDEEAVTRLRAIARGMHGPARILFDQGQSSVEMAGLINGTAAQAVDFDDATLEGHPSAVLVPVALAVGEEMGASGRDLLTAYVAGYEIWAELLQRDTDKYHARGFHPTGLLGTLAAAACAASLYGLNAIQTRNALAIAASFASGLVANFGSMTKPLQTGHAAESGIRAARLAANGYTGAEDALEHRLGFLKAFSPEGRVNVDPQTKLGSDWAIVEKGLNIKLYPICYAAHRIIDAALDLREVSKVDPTRIRTVKASLGRAQASPLRCHEPTTKVDARFSGEFAVAAALIAGRVTIDEVRDEFVMRQDVQALMRNVSLELLDGRDPEDSLFSPADWVSIQLSDGETLRSDPVRHARGHAKNPASDEMLWDKFETCTRAVLGKEGSRNLFERTMELKNLASPSDMYRAFDDVTA
ncbi:MmgE/PrpD family protein [Microvirga zambiensis]|uniref:MmgE/PrpD family protein n=1 Tax=Microvirga zambiensis TaxID=1402137 RepID=UPI00191E27C3|nr:MmgE/PrpD family protein [Microvirga zambiensis]